ncbi:MAG: HAMP domain-containing histidine kinase [Fretibacterium sp.]|nr:HAMP domain-containing histidine kinase [Fretibacterium sp.]
MRRRSLRTHLLLLYVLLAVLGGIVAPLLGLRVTMSEFDGYLKRKQESDLREIGESLKELYREEGTWNSRRVLDVLRQTLRGPSFVVLYDAEGRRIFPFQGGRGPGPRVGREIGPPGSEALRLELEDEGKTIGLLVTARLKGPGRFEQEFVERLRFNRAIGGALTLLVACALGFFVSGRLSRPILRAAARTERIGRGDYEAELESGSEKPSGIRELDVLTEGVERLRRSLAEQERLRRRLMTDVAHELRTPTAVVKAQLEAMVDGVWEPTSERLGLCLSEVDRLSGLITDVEQVATLEGGLTVLCRRSVDLAGLLEETAESFRPLFEREGVKLRVSLTRALSADIDEGRMRHVIENLLSNALRHTERGGSVELRLDRPQAGGPALRIEVEDTGSGIAPEDLPHVFERFYRADPARRRDGGRGVGLSIVKAAVEAHGGKISVRSRSGEGTVFTVLLPEGL